MQMKKHEIRIPDEPFSVKNISIPYSSNKKVLYGPYNMAHLIWDFEIRPAILFFFRKKIF